MSALFSVTVSCDPAALEALMERLAPQEGDVLICRVPDGEDHDQAVLMFEQLGDSLRDRFPGRRFTIMVIPSALQIERMPEDAMGRLGWVRKPSFHTGGTVDTVMQRESCLVCGRSPHGASDIEDWEWENEEWRCPEHLGLKPVPAQTRRR